MVVTTLPPSLNIRGISSARSGDQASNVIPSTATAAIDMRLVKGISPDQARSRVVDHIRKQGYFIVDHDPDPDTLMSHTRIAKVASRDAGYPAERTSMDLPIFARSAADRRKRPGTDCQAPHYGG